MPVIRLGELVGQIESGCIIEMRATDPGVLYDIPAWCKVHGHKVLEIKENLNEIVLLIEK